MRAFISSPSADVPTPHDRPVPEPDAEQLLVEVHSVALNNGDLSPSDEPTVAGFEFSGVVVSIGVGVDDTLMGTTVMGIGEGALAAFVLAHHTHVLPVPASLNVASAAALPTALTTEYGAYKRWGGERGATVLITAASSGIALHSARMMKELGATRVLATTRRSEHRQPLLDAGFDEVIVAPDGDIAEEVLALTEGEGVDVTFDHVGGEMLAEAVGATARNGAVISVGRLAASAAEINLFTLASRQVRVESVSYGLEPPTILGDLFAGVRKELLSAIAQGRLVPQIARIFNARDLEEAFAYMRSTRTPGKVLVNLTER